MAPNAQLMARPMPPEAPVISTADRAFN